MRGCPVPVTRRRALLAGGLAGPAVLGLTGCTQLQPESKLESEPEDAASTDLADAVVPAVGARQAGVTTPPQTAARWVGLDLRQRRGPRRDAIIGLLRVWTDDIRRLTGGRPTLTDQASELVAAAHRLTITVAVRPDFLTAAGVAVPPWLAELPPFDIDRLDPKRCGGDVVVQIAADSPIVVAHAHRVLLAGAAEVLTPRWVQDGHREPTPEPASWRPTRNLFGQVDGIVQPAVDGSEDELLYRSDGVWADATSMLVRRIVMDLGRWEEIDRPARELMVGRRLSDGAPMTGGSMHDPPDLSARNQHGLPVIDSASHMRRAMPRVAHERFLRRPYTYAETASGQGTPESGLVFAAFAADLHRQLVPVQQRLAEQDLLNLWTTPTASVVAAVLPGFRDGEWLGERVLDA